MSAKHITGWASRIRHMAFGLVLVFLASQAVTPCAAQRQRKNGQKEQRGNNRRNHGLVPDL